MISKGAANMLNCPSTLSYSATHSRNRLEKAYGLLGAGIIKRILGFALYLLGAKRQEIAVYLDVPYGTLLSFLTRADKYGLDALVDRRKNPSACATPAQETVLEVSVGEEREEVVVRFGPGGHALKLPHADPLRRKIVLLSFLDGGFLSADVVGAMLGCSPGHVRHLARKMRDEGAKALIDRRQGQLVDYCFTPEIKAELVQQFVAHAVSGQSTSSRALSEAIDTRCQVKLSDRSIRWQLGKLGLPRIAKSLPTLVETVKKNSTR
jgi:biotin operon repressor